MRTFLNLMAAIMAITLIPINPIPALAMVGCNLVLANVVFAGSDDDEE
jgi:hypothetical protein